MKGTKALTTLCILRLLAAPSVQAVCSNATVASTYALPPRELSSCRWAAAPVAAVFESVNCPTQQLCRRFRFRRSTLTTCNGPRR
jgi:hypothetical protein